MAMMQIRKAERRKARLRLAIDGPSGSGKTHSSLLLASGLAQGGLIVVIDTEHNSSELEVGKPGIPDYSVIELGAPYSPQRYVEALGVAAQAGAAVVILDSVSHAWSGEGGALEMVDRAAKASRSGNSYTAWRDVTPHHNALVTAMLSFPGHVIATLRTKTAYEIVEDDRGKKAPKKIGLAPVQRDGFEYEFTVVLDLSVDGHIATASKDRTSIFDGKYEVPTAAMGTRLREWLDTGADALPPPVAPAPPATQQPPSADDFPDSWRDSPAGVTHRSDLESGASQQQQAEPPLTPEQTTARRAAYFAQAKTVGLTPAADGTAMVLLRATVPGKSSSADYTREDWDRAMSQVERRGRWLHACRAEPLCYDAEEAIGWAQNVGVSWVAPWTDEDGQRLGAAMDAHTNPPQHTHIVAHGAPLGSVWFTSEGWRVRVTSQDTKTNTTTVEDADDPLRSATVAGNAMLYREQTPTRAEEPTPAADDSVGMRAGRHND